MAPRNRWCIVMHVTPSGGLGNLALILENKAMGIFGQPPPPLIKPSRAPASWFKNRGYMLKSAVHSDFEECNIITRGIGRGGPWKSRLFLAPKWHERSECHLGPKKSYRAIKTTGTLVVLCTRVLLCSVVVCCCRGGGGGGFCVLIKLNKKK
jgi:hypothetical protein